MSLKGPKARTSLKGAERPVPERPERP